MKKELTTKVRNSMVKELDHFIIVLTEYKFVLKYKDKKADVSTALDNLKYNVQHFIQRMQELEK